jgi:hypothetical protein
VRDRPNISYTQLEFNTAAEAGLPRLVYLIGEDAEGPADLFRDTQYGARQEEFRRWLHSGVTLVVVRSPEQLETKLYQGLVSPLLAGASHTPAHSGAGPHQGPPAGALQAVPNFGGRKRRTILKAISLALLVLVIASAGSNYWFRQTLVHRLTDHIPPAVLLEPDCGSPAILSYSLVHVDCATGTNQSREFWFGESWTIVGTPPGGCSTSPPPGTSFRQPWTNNGLNGYIECRATDVQSLKGTELVPSGSSKEIMWHIDSLALGAHFYCETDCGPADYGVMYERALSTLRSVR